MDGEVADVTNSKGNSKEKCKENCKENCKETSKETSKENPKEESKLCCGDCFENTKWTIKKSSHGSSSKKPTPDCITPQKKSKSKSPNRKFPQYSVMRFLPGSVDAIGMLRDFREYRQHRERIKNMKPAMDFSPPRFCVDSYMTRTRLQGEALAYMKIYEQNRHLLMRINEINRLGGKVQCYHDYVIPIPEKPSFTQHQAWLKDVERENKRFYRALLKAQSRYPRKDMLERSAWNLKEMKMLCKMPIVIFDKKNPDLLLMSKPSIGSHLNVTEKVPKIRQLAFLDFRVKDGPYLGRVIIELYKDFAPVTVQNFLQICKGHKGLSYKDCPVHRIVPGKFLVSGDITLGTGRGGYSIYGWDFDEEKRILRHSRPGVLSMVRTKANKNNSQFSISFAELPQFDGCNVVFGSVIEGIKTICDIESYGRKIGKPLKDIYISNCGKYHWKLLKYGLFPDGYFVDDDDEGKECPTEVLSTVGNSKFRNRKRDKWSTR